jgi:hypothetical protein
MKREDGIVGLASRIGRRKLQEALDLLSAERIDLHLLAKDIIYDVPSELG